MLSTLDYFTPTVDLGTFLSVSPPINGNSSDTSLASPTPQAFEGSGTGTATGQLVDCGMGNSSCPGAAGKVCLMQRHNDRSHFFCE